MFLRDCVIFDLFFLNFHIHNRHIGRFLLLLHITADEAAEEDQQSHAHCAQNKAFACSVVQYRLKAALQNLFASVKAGGQNSVATFSSAHDAQDGLAVEGSVVVAAILYHCFVAGDFQIVVGLSQHEPYQRIEPVHTARRQKQQLVPQVVAFVVVQLVSQDNGVILFAVIHLRQQNGRFQQTHHHRALDAFVLHQSWEFADSLLGAELIVEIQHSAVLYQTVPNFSLMLPAQIGHQLPRCRTDCAHCPDDEQQFQSA